MPDINDWAILAANNNDTPPDGWPENTMAYSEVNNTAREGMAVVARYFQDMNGSLTTGGVADAYTLTLNAAYVAYFTGMYIAAAFNAANTGPTTINVNAIGLADITDRGGNPLSANEIVSGGIYELRYDGVQFQLMGSIVGAAVVASGIFTNSNNPDLVDTDVAVNIGAADPDAAQHIEIGPLDIQSKSDISTAAALALNALGGNVLIGAQTGSGLVRGFHSASIVFESNVDQFRGLSTDSGDPTVPDAITFDSLIYSQDGNEYSALGYAASTTLRLINRAHGGLVQINGEDAAGASQVLFQADPDGAAQAFFNGASVLATTVNGIDISGGAAVPAINDLIAAAGETARYGVRSDGGSAIILIDAAGAVTFQQGDAAGASEAAWINFVRAGEVSLRHNNIVRLATSVTGAVITGSLLDINGSGAAGETGMRARNSAGGIQLVAELTSGDGELRQISSAGASEDLLIEFRRNSSMHMYVNAIETMNLGTAIANIKATGNGATDSISMTLSRADNVNQAVFRFNASDQLDVENQRTNGELHLRANDGGVIRSYLAIDPQLDTSTFSFNGTVRGGFREVNVSDFGMAGFVADASGTSRPMGMNVMPVLEQDANESFNLLYNGRIWHKDAGAALTFTCPNDATIPQGATYTVANEDTEDLTIAAATGVTLRWFDGGGVAPPTGSRTLAEAGVATIYKYTDTEWWIWGSGVT